MQKTTTLITAYSLSRRLWNLGSQVPSGATDQLRQNVAGTVTHNEHQAARGLFRYQPRATAHHLAYVYINRYGTSQSAYVPRTAELHSYLHM